MNKIIKKSALLLLAVMSLFMLPTSHADDDTFAIVWISDTQDITYRGYDEVLNAMGAWIMDNAEQNNTRYVVQTGDAVENGAGKRQWDNYDILYSAFAGKIPYISAAGNHEVKKNGYLEYLARPEISAIPSEHAYAGGKSSYATFEAGGEQFIIVAIGYGVEAESTPWVNQVLSEHADRVAIIIIHDYLQTQGRYEITGKRVFEDIVTPNPNVRLVLCGHVCGTSIRTDELDDNGDGLPDRTVTALMYNYQHFEYDCGQLRTLTFNTTDRSIRVVTYSPFTEEYYEDNTLKSGDFVLENAF